jgi:hypothetical protein
MTTTVSNEKLDLVKLRPESFKAGRGPSLVTLEPAYYLTLNGGGNPNEPNSDFAQAIGAMYSVVYPLKMRYKARGMDFKVAPLEGLWWAYQRWGNQQRDITQPSDDWRWRLMIMVPDYVEREEVEVVKAEALTKKGIAAVAAVELEMVDEGLCVQVMHVGPYAAETETVQAMRRFMDEAGLRACGLHHEVYLSDPNRTAPEKMRTLLRQPVRRVEEDCAGATEW